MGLRAGLDGCGKSASTGIRSPASPSRSESLYRLRHSGPRSKDNRDKNSQITRLENATFCSRYIKKNSII